MRVDAVVFRGAGGPEVVTMDATEVRDPGPGEIQIEIAAAAVNRADLLQRRGVYPAPAGWPADVPGLELSGTVVARGPGASRWRDGDRVMAITGGGAMARRITLHEREVVPVPSNLDLVAAAAIPEVFFTAWDALVRQARLGPGEVVLIHSAASGIGTAAVQIARVVGARPIGTSRTAEKVPALVALGVAAEDMLAVPEKVFAPAVSERTGGRGADVILDGVGAAYFEENIRAAAVRGRIVLLGTLGGGSGTAPITMMLAKRLTVIGTVLRARPLEEKIALAQDATAHLVPLFERGALKPVIDQILPMTDVALAHRRMEQNQNVGKIVLRW
jgi:NADPH2:quinone reductase